MMTTESDDDVDKVIAAQLGWARAITRNDVDDIAGYMTDEWVIVTSTGITTADQFLTMIKTGALSHTRMEPDDGPDGRPRVQVYGDTAVLTLRVVSTEVLGGQARDNDEWSTTVFVRRGGRWLAALTHLARAS
jgi:ketosteroid isomerase-like protein